MIARAWIVFAAVALLLSVRAWHERVVLSDPKAGWVYNDFRDAIYFPARALLDGNDPYDGAAHLARYPVGNRFPLYSPAMPLLHAPWALLPFEASAVLYWLTTLALTIVFAYGAWRLAGGAAAGTMTLATLVLASRPGQQNLLNGQPTLELALALLLVLRYAAERPFVAACGLAFLSVKATWALPIAVATAAAGWWRATVLGIALAGVLNGLVVAVLAQRAGGFAALLGPLAVAAGTTHTIAEGHPARSYTRIDAVALVGRVLGDDPGLLASAAITAAILAIAALAIHRLAPEARRDPAARAALAGIVTLTLLVCVYQQPYGMVLLFVPLAALVHGAAPVSSRGLRAVLLTLLVLPLVNFAATAYGLRVLGLTDRWRWVAVTSLNGVALLAAWAIYVSAAWRHPRAVAAPATWRAHWDTHPAPAASFRREAELYVRRLRSDIPIARDADVLDFGCGFGFVADALAPAVRTLAVFEPADAMRRHAREVLARHPNVTWLDLADGAAAAPDFDVVLVNSVVQYMDERELAAWLRRLGGRLRAGGRIVVSDVVPPGHSLAREGLALACRHPRLLADRIATWGWDYLRKLQRLPILRLAPHDLGRLAAEAGLAVVIHPRNLTHFEGRMTAIFTRGAA